MRSRVVSAEEGQEFLPWPTTRGVTSLLSQFIAPRGALIGQAAILGSTSIIVEFILLACYGALPARMARPPRQVRQKTPRAPAVVVNDD